MSQIWLGGIKLSVIEIISHLLSITSLSRIDFRIYLMEKINHKRKVLEVRVKEEKEMRLSLLVDNVIIYVENPKEFIKKTPRTNK